MLAAAPDQQRARAFVPLLWTIPLSVLVHNLEEYPRIVNYAQRHGLPISRRQMSIAVVLATLLPFLSVAAASKPPIVRRRLRLAMAIPALMAVNAGTHLVQTIVLRDYSPGTISGITINIPLAVVLYRQAIREGVLSSREVRQVAMLGAGLMAPTALVLQLLGWGIDRALRWLAADRTSG